LTKYNHSTHVINGNNYYSTPNSSSHLSTHRSSILNLQENPQSTLYNGNRNKNTSTNNNLISVSTNNSNNRLGQFTIAQLNVRSYSSHAILIHDLVLENDIDIFCMNETFLKNGQSMYIINGYSNCRFDRTFKGNGGVAILYKSFFSCKMFIFENAESIASNPNVEVVAIVLQYKFNKSFIVASVYRVPIYDNFTLSKDMETFDLIFNDLLSSRKCVFILGDFNLRTDVSYNRLADILHSHSLSQLVIEPTRGNSLLDLIITNSENLIHNIQVSEPHISDHRLVSSILSFQKINWPKKTITFRNFPAINNEFIVSDLDNVESVSDEIGTSNLVNYFCHNLISTFDTYSPYHSKTFTEYPNKLYLSNETSKLKLYRAKLYKKYTDTGYDFYKDSYDVVNDEVKLKIKSDTVDAFNLRIANKGLYAAVNSVIKLHKKSDSKFSMNVNTMNNYFCKISTDFNLHDFSYLPAILSNTNIPSEDFILQNVNRYELNSVWKSFNNKSNPSIDILGLAPIMIKIALSSNNIHEQLLQLINCSINEAVVPDQLKISKIIPLAKIASPTDPSHLRPIALQCLIGKIIEKCVYRQLNYFVQKHDLLSKLQFGFRSKHSATHAQIALTDTLIKAMDIGHISIILSLDLTKAFDKLPRTLLLKKLEWYRINSPWIASFLNNRGQFVFHDNNYSDIKFTNLGVPQGSTLGPFLFALFINDLPNHIKNCLVIIFADDTTLIISGSPESIKFLLQKLSEDVNNIFKWMFANKMEINPSKTQLLVVGRPHIVKSLGHISIKIGDVTIHASSSIKILGLLIESSLDWSQHIHSLTRKCNSVLWSLYPIQHLLSISNRKIIVNAYVLSIINYMSIIWGTSGKGHVKAVESIIRRAGRFVLGLKKFDSVKNIITNDLKWLFPSYLYQYEVLKMAQTIVNRNCPPFFFDYLQFNNVNTINTRSKSYNYISNSPATKIGKRAFYFQGSQQWISLSDVNLRETTNFVTFKKQLKQFILDKQSNSCYNYDDIDMSNYDDIIERVANNNKSNETMQS
jgi:Reverse transcriptase (RNA-dependent DNA polymerase)/Endonuclease-reverse transcriptase